MSPLNRLNLVWNQLYPNIAPSQSPLSDYLQFLTDLKEKHPDRTNLDPLWYQEMQVYALYVDLFAHNFIGLTNRLSHIVNLGCNTLWLLPILASPGLDQGFDVSNFEKVREDLGGNQEFARFVGEVEKLGLHLIFDLPINHTSDQHPWFRAARSSQDNPYRDFYLWSATNNKFTHHQDINGQKRPNRVIFPHDPADPNLSGDDPRQKWVWDANTNQYYYRTFYRHQPDLNYRNPRVLLEMAKVIAFWAVRGVDGFRADAAPFLWKEEGTNNESLPQTHLILQFFQATAEYLRPTSFIIAEANQPPTQLLDYLKPEECRVAYHFPRMACLWEALITETKTGLEKDLATTPAISPKCQWAFFLRVHDELSLEMVGEEQCRTLYRYLIKRGLDFRNGHGVSGRLSSFLDNDPNRILLAWALLLVQPGSPIIFQGDAEGELNNQRYYQRMKRQTNEDDTRFLNRGPLDWDRIDREMDNQASVTSQVYRGLQLLLETARENQFSSSQLEILPVNNQSVFACLRRDQKTKVVCLHNLSKNETSVTLPLKLSRDHDLLGQKIHFHNQRLIIPGYAYHWIRT